MVCYGTDGPFKDDLPTAGPARAVVGRCQVGWRRGGGAGRNTQKYDEGDICLLLGAFAVCRIDAWFMYISFFELKHVTVS